MKDQVNRRDFLRMSAAAAALAAGARGLAAGADETETAEYAALPRAVQWNKLPDKMDDAAKIAVARDCGFEGIEDYPMEDLDAARLRGEMAREAGVPIHSVVAAGWSAPLSHPDPKMTERGQQDVERSLRTAHAMGAGAILLVPAVVTPQVGYAEAWERSQRNLRPLIPIAEELEVTIAIENVWNRFLLSPLEFAQYVDEFDHPLVQAYFDVGNVVLFGYPQDWIRTLGERIVRVHVKDFKRRGYEWSDLPYEGDVDWPEVRRAFAEVGYEGWITEEFPGGDEDYLRELARRMTRIGEGAATP